MGPERIKTELKNNIDSTPFWLLNPMGVYRYLDIIITKYKMGQPVSLTDLFGHMIGETLLKGVSLQSTHSLSIISVCVCVCVCVIASGFKVLPTLMHHATQDNNSPPSHIILTQGQQVKFYPLNAERLVRKQAVPLY